MFRCREQFHGKIFYEEWIGMHFLIEIYHACAWASMPYMIQNRVICIAVKHKIAYIEEVVASHQLIKEE